MGGGVARGWTQRGDRSGRVGVAEGGGSPLLGVEDWAVSGGGGGEGVSGGGGAQGEGVGGGGAGGDWEGGGVEWWGHRRHCKTRQSSCAASCALCSCSRSVVAASMCNKEASLS